jgi:RNA polymerase sigma factor (sigma-70 family)
MASRQATAVLGHIRKLVAVQSLKQLSDRELLRRFVARRDETAFAAIVQRHGPMVLSACQRVLHRGQDAEDACQATFLVLAQEAASERWQESIANWLYGVARRLALKSRTAAARRYVVEHGTRPRPPADPLADISAREFQTVLDEELTRLPEKYRVPILLCCLEGHARDEAAHQLGWPLPTLKSRLEQAREILRRRLTHRGLTLSAALAGLTLVESSSRAGFAPALMNGTCQAAVALLTGRGAETIPRGVAALVNGAGRAIVFTKTKITAVLLLAGTIAAAGGSMLIPPPESGQDSKVDLKSPEQNPAPATGDDNEMVNVSGRVLDPDGKPFAGAELTVCRWDRDRTDFNLTKPKVLAKSGPDGRFTFSIPKVAIRSRGRGNAYDRAWAQLVAAAEDYAPVWESIRDSEQKEFTLSLAKDDMPIEGRVLDLQGRPVAGADVRIIEFRTMQWSELYQFQWKGLPENVTTDKDGRFRLTGIGRSRMVRLCISGPMIEQIRKYVPTIPGLFGKDSKSATVEIVAGPTKPITGVVRAKDTGKPLVGVIVQGQYGPEMYVKYSDAVRTKTDANGRFRLIGLPKTDKYSLMIDSAEDQGYLSRWLELGDTEGLKPIVKDFDLERGTRLQIRFMDQDTGKPVLGLLHYCPCYDNPRYEEARTTPEPRKHRYLEPDQKGLFNFVVVPGPSIVQFTAGLRGENPPYQAAELNPDDLKAHPLLKKRPPFAGGLAGIGYGHAYRIIDAQPAEKPWVLDIPVYPKH